MYVVSAQLSNEYAFIPHGTIWACFLAVAPDGSLLLRQTLGGEAGSSD